MRQKKPHLNIPITDDLRKKLKIISAHEDRSIVKIVTELVETYVNNHEHTREEKVR